MQQQSSQQEHMPAPQLLKASPVPTQIATHANGSQHPGAQLPPVHNATAPTANGTALDPVDRQASAMYADEQGFILTFPQRQGATLCDFYAKTGFCKFGDSCKFDHPLQYAVRLNRDKLPMRPGDAVCTYYERHGECKFGPACKFHHPNKEMMPPRSPS